LYGQDVSGLNAQQMRMLGGTLASRGQTADIAAENRRLAEMETAGISQRGLAERELTQRGALASEQRALEREQLYGRAMTREEQMSGLGYTGGTLGAQELAQTAEQADLQRGLAREELYGYREDASGRRQQTLGARESQAQRGIQERELTQRGDLAGAELLSREGLARDQRSLDREALYGTGDVRRQGGATLAATQAAQDMSLRRELGRGQLAQDTRRTDLASAELMGYTEDASGRRQQTEGARAERARAGMEGRRLDEIERAGLAGEGLEGQRLRLASEELYGGAGIDPRMGTLASREAGAERASREGLAAADITARATEGRLGRGLAREELYGTGDAQQQMGATLAAREAEAGRTFERGERALDRGVTTGEGQANRRLAREELYGSADYGQDATSLAAQDLALRGELGRGELEERVAAGQAGRFQEGRRMDLATAELYGRGQGQDAAYGDTLQSRLAGEASDRYRREEQRQAIGMMQNIPDDYAVSEREAQIVRDMLGIEGKSDLAINEDLTGHRWATTPEARDQMFNPYGMSLSGYRTPAVDPNEAGEETGDGNGNGKPWWKDNPIYTIG